MTTPEGVATTFQELNGWAIAAIIVGGAALAWKISKGVSQDPDREAAKSRAEKQYDAYKKGSKVAPWNQRARDVLISRGYSQVEANSALRHYMGGGMMSPRDTSAIAVVVGQIGLPQFPSGDPSFTPTSPQTAPGPGAPNAGLVTEYETGGVGNAVSLTAGTPDPDGPSYWYVPSLGFGNTASYRGLAKLYYGDESKAPSILAVNRETPFAPSSVWQQIPPGLITKVPRSLSV